MFTYKALIAVVLVSLWAFILPAWLSWFDDQEPATDTAAASSVIQEDHDLRLAVYEPVTGDTATDVSTTNITYLKSTAHTPTGTHVITSLDDAVVDYETITAEGISSLITTSGYPVGTSIPEYTVLGDFMDVSTTATYSGSISLGFMYSAHTKLNEKDVKLFHWNGAEWEDVTTWVDSERNTVYGMVNSLSWFFIGGEWVWIEDSVPALTSVLAGTFVLLDELSDVWITDTVITSDECGMGKTVDLDVTQCGRALWSMVDWIMNDSVVSWKYWLPATVDAAKGLQVGTSITD